MTLELAPHTPNIPTISTEGRLSFEIFKVHRPPPTRQIFNGTGLEIMKYLPRVRYLGRHVRSASLPRSYFNLEKRLSATEPSSSKRPTELLIMKAMGAELELKYCRYLRCVITIDRLQE
ncbi:hypothetical protein TNCV_1258301 [Trichonephila clavipes]|nr:hypothetical protein TNCV_1258301 [Trichonephila clavipes]